MTSDEIDEQAIEILEREFHWHRMNVQTHMITSEEMDQRAKHIWNQLKALDKPEGVSDE